MNQAKIEQVEAFFISIVGDAYIMGTSGQECTPKLRRERANHYPAYAGNIKKYCPVLSGKQETCEGCKLNGKKAHDCRGATYEGADLIEVPMTSVGSNSQWKDGDCWAAKGKIENMPSGMLCIVFRESKDKPGVMIHTGACLRDGTVVHARGHAYGVVRQPLEDFPWTHYAVWRGLYDEYELPNEDYIILPAEDSKKRVTIRKGSKGDLVSEMQGMLLQLGYRLPVYGIDGDFGNETLKAVKAFQKDYRLAVDGKCGPMTWAALDYAVSQLPGDAPDEEPDPIDVLLWMATIINLTTEEKDTVLDTWPSATAEQQS